MKTKLLFGFILLKIAIVFSYKFPKDFIFGVATSSYQIEGGWNASGKGENIWDRMTHSRSELIRDGSTGDVACDSYNKWREDIEMCKYLGLDFYRFSLSWARILPNGMANQINPDGIRYYNDLINGLLAVGIEPVVTMFHWDLPQQLQDLGGWANPLMAQYYEEYANIVFKHFGDRVKKWITFNEPFVSCMYGYGSNYIAPAYNLSGIGDYLCSKTVLIAHAKTYRLYYRKYRLKQKGVVGITIPIQWGEPKSNSKEDLEAVEQFMEFESGWFLNPIFSTIGNFPKTMINRIEEMSKKEGYPASRLPTLSFDEIMLIKGSADFLGVNHYTTYLVEKVKDNITEPTGYFKDMGAKLTKDPSWETTSVSWLTVNPGGFRKTLKRIKNKYNNPLIYITENGFADLGELQDDRRVNYYNTYLKSLLEAINEDGVRVKGYAAWSLMDNMEWFMGYTVKFGIFHVDFNDPNRKRTPKASAEFYKNVVAKRALPEDL